jgi:hypothetical protein
MTWESALAGGALIGLASALLALGDGKIAGVSGILGRSVFAGAGDRGWRVAFLAGLPLGAFLAERAGLAVHGFAITSSPWLLVTGGLLVGWGTQFGNGCTSGHGVCGVARGSRRSLVATATFLATGFATLFVLRHGLGVA